MRYDEYLAQGLPIASGPVEGACKNLIKDRMERSGMHWTESMAEAIVQLRAIYLSGDFQDYWAFSHFEGPRTALSTRSLGRGRKVATPVGMWKSRCFCVISNGRGKTGFAFLCFPRIVVSIHHLVTSAVFLPCYCLFIHCSAESVRFRAGLK